MEIKNNWYISILESKIEEKKKIKIFVKKNKNWIKILFLKLISIFGL